VLRAMQKTPDVMGAFFSEVSICMGANANLDRWVLALQKDVRDLADLEFRARDMVDRIALAMQAAQLVQHAPSFVAEGAPAQTASFFALVTAGTNRPDASGKPGRALGGCAWFGTPPLPAAVHSSCWAAAGFIDTLLRWKMKLEVVHGNEKAIQP
jgi:hypothetical protein